MTPVPDLPALPPPAARPLHDPCRHPHRGRIAWPALALATALLTGAAGMASAQPAAAPAVGPASVSVPAPTLTPSRDLPLVRAPSGEPAMSPYGLQAVWSQGDPIARATLLILLLMSVASWYVLVRKLIEQSRLRRQAVVAAGVLAGAGGLRDATERLPAGSVFRYIADAAGASLRQHDQVAGQVDLNTWLTQNIERSVAGVQSRSQDGLAVLATVGATAPFVGLFGTVWGIYHALVKIGASGQASIDRVAGPVGEALIMTALGLAVAVPAVLAYNWLVRRSRLAMEEVRNYGSELHTRALATAAAARRTAAPAAKA